MKGVPGFKGTNLISHVFGVGIDLLMRAGRNAEMDARARMTSEDVEQAYGVSRFVHLRYDAERG